MSPRAVLLRPVAPGPYDGARLLAFLGHHAVPGVEGWDGTTYDRVLQLPGGPGRVALRAASGGVEAVLHCAATDRPALLAQVRRLLDLDRDARPAQATLAADPALGALVRQRPGLRLPGDLDAAQTLLGTVVGQQVSLVAVAAALAGGLDPASASEAELTALPGVGAWTAGYVRLRSAGDPDVFLAGDLAARRQAERYGLPGAAGPLARAALAWRPYRSTALLHLWTDYLEQGSVTPA